MPTNPTPTAYWTQETHLFTADEFVCSACGRASAEAYTVCPCCGAEMTKVKYDPSWVDEAEILDIIMED